MSSSDLQAIFSNLKPRSSHDRASASPAPAQASRPASTTIFTNSRVPSTPPSFPPNVEATAVMNQSGPMSTTANAQTLLNLLNYGNSSATASIPAADVPLPSIENPGQVEPSSKLISASDLVARMRPMSGSSAAVYSAPRTAVSSEQQASSTPRNPLLDLLNKQAISQTSSVKPPQVKSPQAVYEDRDPESGLDHQYTPDEIANDEDRQDSTELQESRTVAAPKGKSIFTYTNPFDALNASRSQTPKTPAPQPDLAAFKFSSSPTPDTNFGGESPAIISARKKLTPKLRSQPSGNSPHPEQTPTFTDAPSPPTPVAEPTLALRQKQPKVETPGTALADEVPASVVQTQANINQSVEARLADNGATDGQDGSGDWEDEDDRIETQPQNRIVPVYNFPIKAFVSITLQLGASSGVKLRDGSVMPISRLKKDFDQLDRSLAAATNKYITYAFTKHGGMRIIRQDDGSDRQVFKQTHDRVFNVALCTTAMTGPASDMQAVLGTGVSGAVYYATVSKEGNDLFEKNQLETESLVFPPWPQSDENTAGGVLKTRAKRSSRHPEYFAIGRGKSIHLIWPATALSPRYGINETNRTVDIAKFYTDRALQIQTGKAGKDFTFSEDDTMIVSLDKTGRLRFWDIRKLVDEEIATSLRPTPAVIDTPVLSLSTASPAEKSWPTSVLFVDKSRPYIKGGALRYVLVGLRQNHTLQLWDIALGKAVQEINFPHGNETDGICSVNYHPGSGIIAVGHPSRNSIFFIHLSAPRYTLSSQLSQAAYVSRVAAKDSELPKPESTACMSGIREISFADKGELRSIEMLPIQKAADSVKSADSQKFTDDQATLFELYVFHSKGVSCLSINKQDLGWSAESKVLHSIDAEREGIVTLKELKLGSVIEEQARSVSPAKDVQQAPKVSKKKAKKVVQATNDAPAEVEVAQQPLPVIVSQTDPVTEFVLQGLPAPKEQKKGKKKSVLPVEPAPTDVETRAISPLKELQPMTNDKVSPSPSKGGEAQNEAEKAVTGLASDFISKELGKIEAAVSAEFKKELADLYQNVSTDRAAQDKISLTRHESILRLVSSSLGTNVEKSLANIVIEQVQKTVLPSLIKTTSDQMTSLLTKTLDQTMSRELDNRLSKTVTAALQSPQMSRGISDAMGQKLSKHLESHLTDLVSKTITPTIKNAAQSIAETESRLNAQIQQLQKQRELDEEKIDKLSQVMQGMADILKVMSDTQVAFQGQILRDREQAAIASNVSTADVSRQVSTARASPSPAVVARPMPTKPKTKAELEFEEVAALMSAGNYEEGTIKWLQASQPAHLFNEVFVRFTPEYLATDVSPLVAFSVAVTVASELDTNTERRLEWISAAFDAIDPLDQELNDLTHHAPALISSIIQRLESLYMTLAEREHNNPVLRAIPALAKKARDVRNMFTAKGAAA